MPRTVVIPCIYACRKRFSGQEAHDRHRDWRSDRCRTPSELIARGFVLRGTVWHRDPAHRVSERVGQSALFGEVSGQAANGSVRPTQARRMARFSDPTTSARAAKAIAPRTGTLKALLLAVYLSAPEGLTDEEAASRAGISLYSATKRCADLRNDGWIVAFDERRGSSGQARQVCRAREQVA